MNASEWKGLALWLGLILLADSVIAIPPSAAVDPTPRLVEIQFKAQRPHLVGELVAESPKYGLLILGADGQLTAIPPSASDGGNPELAIASIQEVEGPLPPCDAAELAERIKGLMPQGTKSIQTEHFVVCYNTTDVYARWNANLYERMYIGMRRFWKEKGIEVQEPRFPMVALIFGTRDEYLEYAKRDFRGAESTSGYYTQTTNRLATFDLTGIEGMLPPGAKVQREELITEIFSRPQAERQVATILHEASHQIAFNTGVQKRLGDYPLWVSEGMATFFESPDFSSSSGWGGTGKVNRFNLANLRRYAPQRPEDSLVKLLSDDKLLRQGETATAAYAESWGLTFFLIKRRPKQYVEYLKLLKDRPIGQPADPKQRLADFKQCFGEDLDKLNKEFIRFIGTLP
ncbi:MAG: DUF1570 domain-containing protein [Planctomycetota bacterium]|jgi:hypothetical protein